MAKRRKSKKINKYTVLILAVVVLIAGVITYFQSDKEESKNESTSNWAEDLANAGLLPNQNSTGESSGLCVEFVDVGQGDCTIVTLNGRSALIDCGEAEYYQTVKSNLKSKGISKLDIVIATHPHSDHIGGMYMLIEDFDIGRFIMPKLSESLTPTTKTYLKMIKALKEKSITPEYAEIGRRYQFDKAFFTILGPVSEIDDLNSMSVVSKLEYGKTSFLLTADAEQEEEELILDTYADLKCDVLKVAHHASSTSTSDEFLDEADPKYAVISVGKDNSYDHPHWETLDKLLRKGVMIFRTDERGNIKFRVPSEDADLILPQ